MVALYVLSSLPAKREQQGKSRVSFLFESGTSEVTILLTENA